MIYIYIVCSGLNCPNLILSMVCDIVWVEALKFFFYCPFVGDSSVVVLLCLCVCANLSAFRTFVRFALVWFCLFPLPLGVWEGLRFVIVALPGFFSYLLLYVALVLSLFVPHISFFWCLGKAVLRDCGIS